MRVGYFMYNGKRYESGAKFLFNGGNVGTFLWEDYDSGYISYVYTPIPNCYNVFPSPSKVIQKRKDFWNNFESVVVEMDNRIKPPVLRQRPDFQIDNMDVGWAWYITLMLISTIFHERIGLWALFTAIFFTWRSKKIKKEGMYYERQV